MKQLMRRIEGGVGALSSIGSFFAGTVLLAMIIVIVFEVVMRKAFNAPTMWSIELVTFLMVWFGFLTLAVIQKRGRHVHVDLFVGRMDVRTRTIWQTVPLLFSILFTMIIIYYTMEDFLDVWRSDETTNSIWGPPIWPVKLALPVGGVLLFIQLLSDFFSNTLKLVDGSWSDQPGVKKDLDYSIKPFFKFLLVFLISAGVGFWLMLGSPIIGLFCLLLTMLFAGVPIFVTLGLLGMTGLYFNFGGFIAISQVPGIIDSNLGSFTLAALPPFILSGFILQRSGAGEELYDFFSKWIGRLPGGLGISTTLSCAFFAAISISSVATVATIGLIAIPALVKRKYDPGFSYGLVGSGSTLGIMIPPSGTMILYAMVTEESLGQLLVAGLIPGLVLAGLFIIYTIVYAIRTDTYDKEEPPSMEERWRSTGKAIWTILVPFIIVFGIFSGVFTVLECGAVAALYTLIMVLVRRKIGLKDIPGMLSECGINAGFIIIIIAGAMILGRFITLSQVPQMAMESITEMNLAPGLVITLIICMLTLMGMFLEVASIMLITLPIIYPVVIGLGYNGIWFAVLMTIVMELAIITPPVGMNLYVIQGFTGDKMSTIIRGTVPFFFLMVLGMFIIYFFPQISLFLPRFVGF
ncbi:TRAP transporter large permease subunit [bacterium]|nr:TRAP transporter large permease subunit [bacterium]